MCRSPYWLFVGHMLANTLVGSDLLPYQFRVVRVPQQHGFHEKCSWVAGQNSKYLGRTERQGGEGWMEVAVTTKTTNLWNGCRNLRLSAPPTFACKYIVVQVLKRYWQNWVHMEGCIIMEKLSEKTWEWRLYKTLSEKKETSCTTGFSMGSFSGIAKENRDKFWKRVFYWC